MRSRTCLPPSAKQGSFVHTKENISRSHHEVMCYVLPRARGPLDGHPDALVDFSKLEGPDLAGMPWHI